MSFLKHRYSFKQVAKAAGLKHDTALKWVARELLVLRPEDREERGRAGVALVSARTALQLILAAELGRRGMGPEAACMAAEQFAHWGDNAGELAAKHDRKAGHLYPTGLTIFFPNRLDPASSETRRYEGDEPLSLFRMHSFGSPPVGIDAVDLEMLFTMRLGGLGLDVHQAIADMKA